MRGLWSACALAIGVSLLACTGAATDPPDPPPAPKPDKGKEKGKRNWREKESLTRITVHQGAVARSAWLHVPRVAGDDPRPLVVVFHGEGGDGSRIAAWFEGWYDRGAILAFPDGKVEEGDTQVWDGIGRPPDSLEDVEFTRSLVDQISRSQNVDPDRVFAAGYAAGGFMTWQLACRAGTVFDGFAIVAASMPRALSSDCPADGGPHPVLLVVGTEDPRVLWPGDNETLGVMDALEPWQKRSRCDLRAAKVEALPDTVQEDGVRVERHTWDCEGPPVALLAAKGGGHPWPRSDARGRHATRDIDAADEIMAFFGIGTEPAE